jgi:hypothetical protein
VSLLIPYHRFSSEFSYHLARCIDTLLKTQQNDNDAARLGNPRSDTTADEPSEKKRSKRIGFICCPTGYVAFRYLYPETSLRPHDNLAHDDKTVNRNDCNDGEADATRIESYLFDYDERFSLLAPPQSALQYSGPSERFVLYDLNEPLSFPSSLEGQLDMVIIDPPCLNAEANLNIAQTVRKLLRSEEDGQVLLITGQCIADQACEIYDTHKTGLLKRAEKLEVQHVGLKNEFAAWGNWNGIERFGLLE